MSSVIYFSSWFSPRKQFDALNITDWSWRSQQFTYTNMHQYTWADTYMATAPVTHQICAEIYNCGCSICFGLETAMDDVCHEFDIICHSLARTSQYLYLWKYPRK